MDIIQKIFSALVEEKISLKRVAVLIFDSIINISIKPIDYSIG